MSSLNGRVISPSNVSSNENRSPQYHSTNSSLLLEKTKLGLRRSTPDSEALASSDDEQDSSRNLARITSQPLPKPTRRPSWINDPGRNLNRKSSIGTAGLGMDGQSPVHTPDGNTWGNSGSPLARVSSGDNSYPWGSSSIWSNGSTSKIPPSRLAEMISGAADQDSLDESLRSPGIRRDSSTGGPIPFAIPLKPTLKAYRSQSYSVGQMETELDASQQVRQSQNSFGGRTRAGTSYGGLQSRGSRPSMLGDHGYDNPGLEQLREVDDDEDDNEENTSQPHIGGEVQTQQQLELEHALRQENNVLRQKLANLSLSAQRGADGTSNYEATPRTFDGRRGTFSEAVLEEVDDLADDSINNGHYAVPLSSRGGRRMSELNGPMIGPGAVGGFANNKYIENVRRNHWQSSLGFGGINDQPQSRRHSFADVSVPKRQVSLGSIGGDFPAVMEHQNERLYSPTSFHGQQPRAIASSESNRSQFAGIPSALSSPPSSSRFGHHASFEYGQHQLGGPGRSNLYMVTFKASRAEFYYVPTGVGLEIKEGDLVIVEADRGTDLGTVIAADVPWNDTKKLREQQAEEHYRWLMMFSRRRADGTMSSGSGTEPASNGSPNGASGPSATGDHMLARKEEQEIKPKMIKRLAYQHEIQQLKEKEANEAKAKRICQAKADEHGLDMEILDAEFQMDWKKLTFYYFADAYINFNSLVTDLFKTYKTRIWMSAINPASFQTPPAALAPPSLISPGAILPGSSDHRQASLGLHGAAGAGYAGMSGRGGFAVMGTGRNVAGMGDMLQHPFWIGGQGVNGGLAGQTLGYENPYGAPQQTEDLDFARYGDMGANRGARDLHQQNFAQHMASSQQHQHQQQHSQQAATYGMRSGLY